MTTKRLLVMAGFVLALAMGTTMLVRGQSEAQGKYECAMIKWDGPDKLAVIYPDRAEVVRVFKFAKATADVSEEEFCLAWGANKLAKEGWEPVNLNSRRVFFRRAVKH